MIAHKAGIEWQGKRAKNRAPGGPSTDGAEKDDSEKTERERGEVKEVQKNMMVQKPMKNSILKKTCKYRLRLWWPNAIRTAFGNETMVLFNLARAVPLQ